MNKVDDLQSWRYFVHLLESHSLSQTARFFSVEVSTVARSLDALENAVGEKLYIRRARRYRPTSLGKKFLHGITEILDRHADLMQLARAHTREQHGVLRISATPGFTTRRLMPILKKYMEEYPYLDFEVDPGRTAEEIAQGMVDVGNLSGRPEAKDLVYLSRGRDVFIPVATPEYIQDHGGIHVPEMLKNHTIFLYRGQVRRSVEYLYRGARYFSLRSYNKIYVHDILAVRSAVLSHMGVALDLPLVQTYEDLKDGRLIPILSGWHPKSLNCYIATSRFKWRDPHIRQFMYWYAQTMYEIISGYEKDVSDFVALPSYELDRTLYRT